MDEEEFDSLLQSRSFTTPDATLADAQLRRRMTLAIALWGRTVEDLKRQLLAPSPEIPSGYDLTDFQELHRTMRSISDGFSNPRHGLVDSIDSFFSDNFHWRTKLECMGGPLRGGSPRH